jgi:hypothetical protein
LNATLQRDDFESVPRGMLQERTIPTRSGSKLYEVSPCGRKSLLEGWDDDVTNLVSNNTLVVIRWVRDDRQRQGPTVGSCLAPPDSEKRSEEVSFDIGHSSQAGSPGAATHAYQHGLRLVVGCMAEKDDLGSGLKPHFFERRVT